MAIKIAVGFQKGGVGKTNTTVILAELLAASGYKVLLIDLDTQGNATKMVTGKSIYSFTGVTVMEGIRRNQLDRFIVRGRVDLIPAEDELALFPRFVYKSGTKQPAHVLAKAIAKLEEKTDYDFILFDLPPALGDITANAVVATDYIIIPMHPDGFGLETVEKFLHFIEDEAEVLGILLTLVDKRAAMERAVCEEVRERYGELVFSSVIRKKAAIGEFSVTGVVMDKKREIDALEDYANLAVEVIERVNK